MLKSARNRDRGQEVNRRSRKLKAAAPRLVGVLVTAALLAAFVYVLRMGGGEDPAPAPAATARRPDRRVDPRRAAHLQPLRRRRPGVGAPEPAAAGAAGPHQPRHLRAGAVAGREVGLERRRPHPHPPPAPGTDLVRRHAADRRGRAVLAARRLRPEGGERPRRQPDAPAASRFAPPRRIRKRSSSRSRRRRAGASGCSTVCRSCRSTSSKPRSPPAPLRRPTTPARRRRRSSARVRSCCASTSRASASSWTATRATGARRSDGAALPYLDRLVLQIVPEQNAELLRLQSGETDLTSSELRAGGLRAGAARGRGRAASPDRAGRRPRCRRVLVLPQARGEGKGSALRVRVSARSSGGRSPTRWTGRRLPRRCSSAPRCRCGDRSRPGNTRWFWPDIPRYPHNDDTREELLREIGLEDRNGNGVVEDAKGTEARFTVITQRGIGWYERGTAVVRDELARVGIALEIAPLELGALIQRAPGVRLRRDVLPSGDDRSGSGRQPGLLAQLGLEPLLEHVAEDAGHRLGAAHRHADARAGGGARSGAAARCSSGAVQRIFAENLPVLYFAAPRMYYAHSARLRRRRAVGAAAAGAVERRQSERDAMNVRLKPDTTTATAGTTARRG